MSQLDQLLAELHRAALRGQAEALAEVAALELEGCGDTTAAAYARVRLAFADWHVETTRPPSAADRRWRRAYLAAAAGVVPVVLLVDWLMYR